MPQTRVHPSPASVTLVAPRRRTAAPPLFRSAILSSLQAREGGHPGPLPPPLRSHATHSYVLPSGNCGSPTLRRHRASKTSGLESHRAPRGLSLHGLGRQAHGRPSPRSCEGGVRDGQLVVCGRAPPPCGRRPRGRRQWRRPLAAIVFPKVAQFLPSETTYLAKEAASHAPSVHRRRSTGCRHHLAAGRLGHVVESVGHLSSHPRHRRSSSQRCRRGCCRRHFCSCSAEHTTPISQNPSETRNGEKTSRGCHRR